MTNTSKTILFFGTDDFSAVSLEALIAAGYTIGAAITKPDNKKGRGRKVVLPMAKQIALRHNIPVWQPEKVSMIANDIAAFSQPVGVLVSFGKIIPQSIIDLFTPGIINVHPSLLPLYRGPSPIESAIAHGDQSTGVSLMKLSAAMDAGPVYIQQSIPLLGNETRPELYTTLADQGATLLVQHLDDIVNGTITPRTQDDAAATYSKLLYKSDGIIDPSLTDAATIERKVRAFLGYPKTRLPFKGTDTVVTKVHVATTPDETTIACAGGSLIAVDELIAPTSGKTMTAQAYLRGLH